MCRGVARGKPATCGRSPNLNRLYTSTIRHRSEPSGGGEANEPTESAFNLPCRHVRVVWRRVGRRCPDRCRRDHRHREGSGRGSRSWRNHYGHRNAHKSSAGHRVHRRWHLRGTELGAWRLPPRCRTRGLQTGAPRRHPACDRREGARRFQSEPRRHSRTGDGGRRLPDRAERRPRASGPSSKTNRSCSCR